MNIKYLLIKHDISEKADDDTAPIFGIVLMDMDNVAEKKEYGMSRQLKDFLLAMQKYGLAWSEKYKEYVIPDEICFQKDKFKQYIALIENIIERFNRGESIVSENSIYEELEKYRLTLDCNNPKRQAIEILESTYVGKLSNHMKEFLQHIANSQWISLDDVTTDFGFGFENTHARAFYIREIVRQRKKENNIKIVHSNYDEGR